MINRERDGFPSTAEDGSWVAAISNNYTVRSQDGHRSCGAHHGILLRLAAVPTIGSFLSTNAQIEGHVIHPQETLLHGCPQKICPIIFTFSCAPHVLQLLCYDLVHQVLTKGGNLERSSTFKLCLGFYKRMQWI